MSIDTALVPPNSVEMTPQPTPHFWEYHLNHYVTDEPGDPTVTLHNIRDSHEVCMEECGTNVHTQYEIEAQTEYLQFCENFWNKHELHDRYPVEMVIR